MIRSVAERLLGSRLSRQLSGPSGLLGNVIARQLNRGNRPAIAAAVNALALQGGETVADIGFGGGVGLGMLLDAVGPSGRVHGVEPAPDMIARARRTFGSRVDLHETSMESLPFADGALDGWISLNTIYFVGDLSPAFAELVRVSAPGGCGVVSIGDPEWMAAQPFTRHHFTLRPVTEVLAALASAGFEVERRDVEGGPAPFHLLLCRR